MIGIILNFNLPRIHCYVYCTLQVGSPTAFADKDLETKIPAVANQHGVYIPSGAFWGGEDIKKMADRGTLQALSNYADNTEQESRWAYSTAIRRVVIHLHLDLDPTLSWGGA